jgi:hypothetical protein
VSVRPQRAAVATAATVAAVAAAAAAAGFTQDARARANSCLAGCWWIAPQPHQPLTAHRGDHACRCPSRAAAAPTGPSVEELELQRQRNVAFAKARTKQVEDAASMQRKIEAAIERRGASGGTPSAAETKDGGGGGLGRSLSTTTTTFGALRERARTRTHIHTHNHAHTTARTHTQQSWFGSDRPHHPCKLPTPVVRATHRRHRPAPTPWLTHTQ